MQFNLLIVNGQLTVLLNLPYYIMQEQLYINFQVVYSYY